MSYSTSSDEVAEDYKRALEDLSMNTRFEISNLTVIAKENTEHALAISEALKNHIRTTSPQKKLPALYVLDSVVKNVGTPYTLFLGRQLFNTFMQAYALVDNNVRRKMDEMLKTWKEPVPGSLDTRPVFPPEITRPIENALIKARTSAVQAEQARNQQMGRGLAVQSQAPYRDSLTPPNIPAQGYNGSPGYGAGYGYQQYPQVLNGQYLNNQPYPSNQQYNGFPQDTPQYALPQRPQVQYPPRSDSAAWQQPQTPHYPSFSTPDPNNIDTLLSDIASLITDSKQDFAKNPLDSNIQTRLKALLDLQSILQNQTLPPEEIRLIRGQVAQLSQVTQSRTPVPPVHVSSPKPVVTTPSPVQPTTLSSLLGPGAPSALAALLAKQSATPQISTPPIQHIAPVRSPIIQNLAEPPYNPPPATPTTTSPPLVSDAGSLLERLRAAGMLPAAPAPAPSATSNLPSGFPSSLVHTLPKAARTPLADLPSNDAVLKLTSLKMPRPHLISTLHENLGIPCTQCGRRFPADEHGRKKRSTHMDWHFRTHQRMTEAEKKGQHRSWYVDEFDWIKSRESQDDDPSSLFSNGDIQGGSSQAAKPELQYVAVPDDPALAANSTCPICQEKFEMKWLDGAQEFVWVDAKKIGERIYHATCYADVSKDGEGREREREKDIYKGWEQPQTIRVEPSSRLGLESILGKRKAMDDQDPIALKTKIKTES